MFCSKCGKPMKERKGIRGPFMGCTGYPKCKETKQIPGAKPTPKGEVVGVIEEMATPSAENLSIFELAQNHFVSIFIAALAGTGKTTQLVQLVRIYVKRGFSVACLAFAGRDKEALSQKTKGNAKVLTSNGAGLSILGAWARKRGRNFLKFNDNASDNCLWQRFKEDELIKTNEEGKDRFEKGMAPVFYAIVNLVKQARTTLPLEANHTPSEKDWMGLAERFDIDMPQEHLPNILFYAPWLFKEMANLNNIFIWGIDFANQLFLPVYHQLPARQQYDVVMVDETQDQNYYTRAIAKLFKKPNGIYVMVGDRHQAIYAWRGADYDSMDLAMAM